jgi:general secretion pathway protein J
MNPRGPRSAGFTLLELTVALAIFALLSTLAYGGLRQVLEARDQTARVAARLSAVQSAVAILCRDLEQAVPREVRDEYGDRRAPLLARPDEPVLLELTTGGWRNPAGLPRSTLRRVGYGLDLGTLRRYTWAVLDRAQDSRPRASALLSEVRRLEMQFLDESRNWHPEWPPLGTAPEAAGLPLAVEVTLELEDWGLVQRVVRLPDGVVAGAQS